MGRHATIAGALRALYQTGLLRILTRNEIRLYLHLILFSPRRGSRVAPRALCRRLGVSRTILMRALSRLEQKALIRVDRTSKGARMTVVVMPIRKRR